MSDVDTRRLERDWRESGSPENEAAWLEARVRAGDLAEGRLQLAACLEHPAAALLREPGSRQRPFEAQPRFQRWLEQMPLWDRRVIRVRLGVAFLARSGPLEPPYGPCLFAVEDWICCPCPEHEDALSERRADCDRVSLTRGRSALPTEQGDAPSPADWLPRLGAAVVPLVGAVLAPEERARAAALKAIDGAISARYGWWEPDEARRLVEAQREDVVPWLLGVGDPVLERVRARRAV